MDVFILGASFVYWVAMLGLVLRVCRRVPDLRSLNAPAPASWPKVSLIVPARDEADTLAPALFSKVSLRYPNLEVILIDDRSTDTTLEVAHRIADAHDRLKVLRLDTLPRGWLGKVHAMQRGIDGSTGDWLLLCDADVHIEASALQRVIAYAEQERADHITMLPRITATDPTLVCTLSTFLRQLCVGGRLAAVADPRSSASVGVGAFNLIRREMLERTAGMAGVRMELNDDVALGRMLKRAGARQRLLNGSSALALEFCPSFAALSRTLEKNGGTANVAVVLGGLACLGVLEYGFIVGLFSSGTAAFVLGMLAWASASLATLRICQWLRLPRWPAIVPFLGMAPLAWALGRSAALAWWRGGVFWRGTFYPRHGVRPRPQTRSMRSGHIGRHVFQPWIPRPVITRLGGSTSASNEYPQ